LSNGLERKRKLPKNIVTRENLDFEERGYGRYFVFFGVKFGNLLFEK
jgi:hypothetical protein